MEATGNTPSSSLKRMRPEEEDNLSIDIGGQSPPKKPRETEPDLPIHNDDDPPPQDKGKQRMVPIEPLPIDQKNEKLVGELELELSCGCCAGIAYKPVIVQPCQHFFCGSCLTLWIQNSGSNSCPECRSPSTIASPSRTIQSIIELFLRHRPDLQRPEAERIQADAVWKTGKDIIIPQPKPPNPDVLLPQAHLHAGDGPNGGDNLARPCPHCLPHNQFGWRCPRPIVDPEAASGSAEGAWNLDDGPPPGHGFCGACSELHALHSPGSSACSLCHTSFCGLSIPQLCVASSVRSSRLPQSAYTLTGLLEGHSESLWEAFGWNEVEIEILLDWIREGRSGSIRDIYAEIIEHIRTSSEGFRPMLDSGLFVSDGMTTNPLPESETQSRRDRDRTSVPPPQPPTHALIDLALPPRNQTAESLLIDAFLRREENQEQEQRGVPQGSENVLGIAPLEPVIATAAMNTATDEAAVEPQPQPHLPALTVEEEQARSHIDATMTGTNGTDELQPQVQEVTNVEVEVELQPIQPPLSIVPVPVDGDGHVHGEERGAEVVEEEGNMSLDQINVPPPTRTAMDGEDVDAMLVGLGMHALPTADVRTVVPVPTEVHDHAHDHHAHAYAHGEPSSSSTAPAPAPPATPPVTRVCRDCAFEILLHELYPWWERERRRVLALPHPAPPAPIPVSAPPATSSAAGETVILDDDNDSDDGNGSTPIVFLSPSDRLGSGPNGRSGARLPTWIVRPDCPDGRECTRQSGLSHAKEFNHIINPNRAQTLPIPEGDANGLAQPLQPSEPVPQPQVENVSAIAQPPAILPPNMEVDAPRPTSPLHDDSHDVDTMLDIIMDDHAITNPHDHEPPIVVEESDNSNHHHFLGSLLAMSTPSSSTTAESTSSMLDSPMIHKDDIIIDAPPSHDKDICPLNVDVAGFDPRMPDEVTSAIGAGSSSSANYVASQSFEMAA